MNPLGRRMLLITFTPSLRNIPMKPTFKCLVLFFVANLLISTITANCQSIVHANSWEQLSQGIAIAIGQTDSRVTISVKNTSDTRKELIRQKTGAPVQLFYIDDQGAQVPLGDHEPPGPHGDRRPGPIGLPADGQVATSMAIHITSDELVLIKTHQVLCSVLVNDPATKQQYTITSSPKILPGPADK